MALPAPTASSAHLAGPPPGHTGGFGDPTCRACHAEFDPDVGGSLTLEGVPAAYQPGKAYVVSVVLRSTEMAAAGFQATARFEGNGRTPAGTLTSVDARTAVAPDSTGPLRYVQHVSASARPSDPEFATWSFQWTAPSPGAGPVVFNAAANSANGDDSPLGDLVYTTEVRVVPASGGRRETPGAE